MLKTRLIQKRLRMSRTMACMSMPAPWPISCAMSCCTAGAIAPPPSLDRVVVRGLAAQYFRCGMWISVAWVFLHLGQYLALPLLGLANVLGQNLAVAMEPAIDD